MKFMSAFTKLVPYDLGLRSVNLTEAQAADRALWTSIFELIQEESWTWENALHEITSVRGDLMHLMQARPKHSSTPTPRHENKKPLAIDDRPWKNPRGDIPQGKGKGNKDKGKGKGNKGKVEENDGRCKRYNLGKCGNKNCQYDHTCNFWLGTRVCGERHSAINNHTIKH